MRSGFYWERGEREECVSELRWRGGKEWGGWKGRMGLEYLKGNKKSGIIGEGMKYHLDEGDRYWRLRKAGCRLALSN